MIGNHQYWLTGLTRISPGKTFFVWLKSLFKTVSLYANQINLSFFKLVEMNVIQNVQVSTHFQDVCFFLPVISLQKGMARS